MNLAEFPLAALADRVPKDCKTLVFEDQAWDKGQKQWVLRRLTISASDKFGLPTALDDEVIVGLVQLSKAINFADRHVPFSRYQLVHLLGWRDEGKSYARVEESLKRWLGVSLYYENAWWDKCRKRWMDAHFHLLDNVTLCRRPRRGERASDGDGGRPLSSFTWNDIIFRSFQAGNLRSIDLDFYRSLKSSVAKRMYRFLDKHFYFGVRQQYRLMEFAQEHIGLSRNYDVAQLKRRLSPAIEELENGGYLEPMPSKERFICMRRGQWDVVFVRAAKATAKGESNPPVGVAAQLIERGVTGSTAAELVRIYPADKIKAKLQVFDQLTACRDRRISKNPAGYLVQSIRKDYMPPAEFRNLPAAIGGRSKTPTRKNASARKPTVSSKKFYVEQKIQKHLAELSPEGLAELEIEALKSSPSLLVQRFRQAVVSGSEKLVREYRRCLLEGHLRAIFRLRDASTSQRT
ncbi:MAG: replication initiator protein A [Thermoguttaceae bacterium]